MGSPLGGSSISKNWDSVGCIAEMKTTVNELHCNTKEKKETRGDDRAGLSAVWQKEKAAPQPLEQRGKKAEGVPTWRGTGSAKRGRGTEVQLPRSGCRRTWWRARSMASSSAHSSWRGKKKGCTRLRDVTPRTASCQERSKRQKSFV